MLLIVELPNNNALALDVDPTFSVADVLALIDIETRGLRVVALGPPAGVYAHKEFLDAQDSGTLADLLNFPAVFEVRAVSAKEYRAYKKLRTFTVYVKTLTGRIIALEVKSGEQYGVIRAKITQKEGIPPDQIRLIYGGQELVDSDRIPAVTGGITIHLVLRLRGGGGPPFLKLPKSVARHSSPVDVTYLSAYGPETAVQPKETFVLKLLAYTDDARRGATEQKTPSLVQVGMHGPVLLQRETVYPVRLEFDETYFRCSAPEASLLWMGSQSTVSFAVKSIKQDAVRSHILTAVLTLPKGVQARVLFSVAVRGQEAPKPMLTPGDIFAVQNGMLRVRGRSQVPLEDLLSLVVYMLRLARTNSWDRPGMQFAPQPPSLDSSDDGPDQGSSDPTAWGVLPQDFALRLPSNAEFDHDIFISYRRAQIDFADRLRLHLERFGYSVFLDVSDDHGLGAGDFRAQLDRAVKRSRVLMPLFTDAPSGPSKKASKLSSASLMAANHAGGVPDWCLEELRLANTNPDMLIVPVYRENVNIGAEMAALPDGLARVKSSNALPIYDAVFGLCVRRIHRDIQDFFAASEVFPGAPSKRLSQRVSQRLSRPLVSGRASATPARRDTACLIS